MARHSHSRDTDPPATAANRSTPAGGPLLNICHRKGVVIATATPAQGVEKTENAFIVKTQDFIYQAKNLLITTGGLSYPSTVITSYSIHYTKLYEAMNTQATPTSASVKNSDLSFIGPLYLLPKG